MEIQTFIKQSYERAKQILTENRDKLELVAQTLLEVETLDAAQIKHLVDTGKLPDRSEPVVPTEEKSDEVKVNIHTKKEENEEDKN
jgi:cell division protease FtsH